MHTGLAAIVTASCLALATVSFGPSTLSVAPQQEEDPAPVPPSEPPPEAPPEAPPPPPELPPDERRACSTNDDCVLRPISPCVCPPCGTVWRQALNRQAAEEFRLGWANRRCGRTHCRDCTPSYLGTEAYCSQGQCQVR